MDFIDLIFGMWVYNDELQIKFTFRSGPMIVGRVMALGPWNLAKYLVVTTFVHYDLRYWLIQIFQLVGKSQTQKVKIRLKKNKKTKKSNNLDVSE
jgi:hypothetical protein